jgi:archaellum component FlaC
MVETVEIPLSWANNIPGVSGVEDVEFDVPQLDEIVADVEDSLPGIDQIGERVDFITLDIQDIREEVADIPDDVADAVGDVTVDLGDVADEIRQEVDDALDDLDLDITDPLEEALADAEQAISGLELDPDKLADSIVGQLDPEDLGGTSIQFESIFGALKSDIVDGFSEALEEVTGLADDLPDTIESLADGLNTLLPEAEVLEDLDDADRVDGLPRTWEAVFRLLPGGDLLLDPDQFIDDQVDRLTDGLVDEETRQRANEEFGGNS